MRVAALTMAYNEKVWAPVWARFYSGQVGAENCFLLDHGSDDGSTLGLGISVERLARSPLDEEARAAVVSARAAALLADYDAVVHSDVDELVLAERPGGLRAFAAGESRAVVTAAGLDVQHVLGEEAALDPGRPIAGQRRWLRFSAAMCKPAFVRRPVRWSPGFHRCDAAFETGGLFLLHLRYVDLALALQRLGRTRAQAFADSGTNPHQRVSDEAFRTMMERIAQLPREEVALATESGAVAGWVDAVRRRQAEGGDWLSMAGDRLWGLPEAWRGVF